MTPKLIYAEALSSYYTTKTNNRPNARGGVYKASIKQTQSLQYGQICRYNIKFVL